MEIVRQELEEFFGDNVPEYAIISNVWGRPKDEVSFEDMKFGTFKYKPGYRKIQYLCQQAVIDDLSWAWCYTCCIDKSRSAELQEVINSIF